MIVLALDTTTRGGSIALVSEGQLREVYAGDPSQTHGRRLPGDILGLLERQRTRLVQIDLYAVAAGPGSFTGLRIGIATMQGFALAHGRGLMGVSALDALRAAAAVANAAALGNAGAPALLGVWMDAQRGEVFGALYHGARLLDGPTVDAPGTTLRRWKEIGRQRPISFVGDGALAYSDAILALLPGGATIINPVPPLAPAIGMLAEQQAAAGESASPHAIRPIYVRRPDAELARDRTKV